MGGQFVLRIWPRELVLFFQGRGPPQGRRVMAPCVRQLPEEENQNGGGDGRERDDGEWL
jgi:hypothetical protein